MDYEVGMVFEELPETRGGFASPMEVIEAYAIAMANPDKWVLAMVNDLQTGARNRVLRKHPELQVSTRTLDHNTEGRVTVFVMYPSEL